MQKNTLKSGLEISEVGLGCMSLGTDVEHAETIIDEAINQGITYFDTADLYDYGENEKIVGNLLKKYQNNSDIVIGSKVGNHFDKETKEHHWDPSKEHIMNGIKDTLQRLDVEQLDLYMLHGGHIVGHGIRPLLWANGGREYASDEIRHALVNGLYVVSFSALQVRLILTDHVTNWG